MNRDELGGQLCGHLRLYKDLGVRYLGHPSSELGSGVPTPDVIPTSPTLVNAGIPPADSVTENQLGTPPPKPQTPNPEPLISAPEPRISSTPETLEDIRANIGNCQRCKLAPLRKNLVFGVGNPRAELLFVGEGPGADEDAQGIPFVGRAGRLLTLIIEAMGMRRDDVYICNIVKCRPPNNRNPEPDEIAACAGFVFRQIAAVRPRMIVALGAVAAHALLDNTDSIGRLRGRLLSYHGTKLLATYHPSYLLRSPGEKRKVWEDMQIVRNTLRALQSAGAS